MTLERPLRTTRQVGERADTLPLLQPEPGLTPQMLIERARALRPLLREQQDEADLRGVYTDDVHDALLEGGFYRILVPRLFGGYEFAFPDFIRVIMELAQGHPATGWCYTLATSHAYLIASHWSPEAQEDVFVPTGGDVRICQRASPAGAIERVDDGYVVDGVFGFASGAPVATHFLGSSLLADDGGPPRPLNFVVPRANFEVVPDWGGERSLGMRGSGSNSIKLDRVFVPSHHVVDAEIMMPTQSNDGTFGTRLHGNPMYLGVAGGVFITEFGAIFTGTARAALEEYELLLPTTAIPRRPGMTRLDDPEAWRALGKAMNLTDAAEAVTLAAVNHYMELCDRWATTGAPILPEENLKIWGMAQEASQLACRAVDLLFETAGARGTLGNSRLQRYFRDIQMYRVHTTAQPPFATMRAQFHLGAPIPGR
jgi:3-hydroxy-9,10-secoandrosta-1,3,5(10)-triene-9,17-dione monooxygenase